VVGFVTTAVSPAMVGWVGGLAVVSVAAVGGAVEAGSDGAGGAASWQQRLYIINPYAAARRRRVAVV